MEDNTPVLAANTNSVAPTTGPAMDPNEVQWDQPVEHQSAIDPNQVEWDSDKYGTGEQQLKTFIEGAAQGAAGPLATAAEVGLGIAKREDILGRQKENPWSHGIGQGVGLTGSLIAGTGEGALLGKAGEAAAGLAGLGEASTLAKVGSSAVAQAAEMAVLQSGDEVSKMILKDPETSASTAMANVGMAAIMGGTGGAAFGAVSPLWKATAGPKVDEFLTAFKSHLNGTGALELPAAVKAAQEELGIPIENVMNSALSGNPTAAHTFNLLRELDHPEVMRQLANLSQDSQKAVVESLGIPLEEVAVSSTKDAGDRLQNTFLKEYEDLHQPVAARQEAKAELAKTIPITDEDNLNNYGSLIEKGMNTVGTDSPFYKYYHGKDSYGERLLNHDTIGAQDRIKSEVLGAARGTMNPVEKRALNDIANHISAFHEGQIEKQAIRLEAEGAEHGAAIGRDIIAERKAASAEYAHFAGMSQELTDHLGIRDFTGAGGLKKAISEVTPETLVRKFSPKGNVGSIPFLQKYFPKTLAEVQKNEAKAMLKSSVINTTGTPELNMRALATKISNVMKESPELVDFALPGRTVQKVQAAKVLQEALPDYKSSKTASWLQKMMTQVPANSMAMVGALSHGSLGGVGGYAVGELLHRMSRQVPDAARIALLNFLSSDKPVNSAAMKATVDMVHNVYKGESLLNKSVKNVFESSATVLPFAKAMPDEAARLQLDRLVARNQDAPVKEAQQTSSSDLGHYLPQHQTAIAAATTATQQYLQQLKPRPTQTSPLDVKMQPTAAQEARYNRALDIAINPYSVLQHIKQGTCQSTDLTDLKSMWPQLYTSMAQKLTVEMSSQQAKAQVIPYKVRIGTSLFLGQPIDTSMQPLSIQAAQPQPSAPPAQNKQSGKVSGKSATSLNKMSNSYKTQDQAAESDRSDRE